MRSEDLLLLTIMRSCQRTQIGTIRELCGSQCFSRLARRLRHLDIEFHIARDPHSPSRQWNDIFSASCDVWAATVTLPESASRNSIANF